MLTELCLSIVLDDNVADWSAAHKSKTNFINDALNQVELFSESARLYSLLSWSFVFSIENSDSVEVIWVLVDHSGEFHIQNEILIWGWCVYDHASVHILSQRNADLSCYDKEGCY